MAAPGKCFLVTDLCGVEKSTLIIKVFKSLKTSHLNLKLQDFYTCEVRSSCENVDFEVITLDGRICPLASTTISTYHALFFFLGWCLR
ncbi:hypothetical protein HN51_054232, partial [Arachis hypogaea]